MKRLGEKCRIVVGAMSLLVGCTAAPDETTAVAAWKPIAELTDAAGWGEGAAETRRVEFEADAATTLGEGWARPETNAEGRTFAWAVGEASELTWTVFEPRDRTLAFRGWPFQFDGAEPQVVRVQIGDEYGDESAWIDRIEMQPGLHEYRVEIPKRHWHVGRNTLRLVPSRATSPSDVSPSTDSRRLSAAWTEIRLADAPEPGFPELPVLEEDRIFLPWNSRLDVFLELPEGGALDADTFAFRGAGRLTVELAAETIEADSGLVSRSTIAVTSAEPPEAPLQLKAGPGPHRLRLTALAHPESGLGQGGVMLLQPRISVPDVAPPPRPVSSPEIASAPDLPTPEVFVLYVVDTLRADHLAAWSGILAAEDGIESVPTPNLDSFASESVVFRSVTAQSPWTKASMASIFTGLWPPEHGAVGREDRLSADVPSLPELLQQAGWRTEAVVTNPNVTEAFGFDRGFDHYESLGEEADAFEVNRAVAERLDSLPADATEPVFLYVHVLDPHSPYDPPSPWRERMAPAASAELAHESLQRLNDLRQGRIDPEPELLRSLHALYRAEIASADAAFGELLDLFSARGLAEPALLYVSDHGEEFLEHGNLEHGRALHAESLWVPMALRWPGLDPAVVDRPVQHLDVLPTLLPRLTRTPQGARLPGTDLLLNDASEPPRPLFSHLHLDGAERASVVLDGLKAIVEFREGCDAATGHRPERRRQLYDTAEDPLEQADLAQQRPVQLGFLASLIRRRLGDCRIPSPRRDEAPLDEETRKSLEALGYL